MQSASIDRGLEVVSQKFEELQPHLVVLDYGMTDQVSRGMNPWLAPFSVLASRGSELFSWLDGLSRMNSTGPVGKLYLFNALVTRSMRKNLPENRAYWGQQTRQLLTYLSSKGVKILLLDQPVAGMEPEPYRKVVSGFPGADFLSVRESLEKVARESHSLPPDPPWMEEFPESFRAYYRKKVPFYFFLGSILHLNSRGHAEVARLLAAWIEAHSLSP
jgi:hypothetical protein